MIRLLPLAWWPAALRYRENEVLLKQMSRFTPSTKTYDLPKLVVRLMRQAGIQCMYWR